MNKVMLIGNLGKGPETRSFSNGGKVCNFSMATNDRWRDKQTGDVKERVTWHNVCIFNEGLAGIAQQYLRKGSKAYIEGQIEHRKYQDQTGAERHITEIVLRQFNGALELLSPKDEARDELQTSSNIETPEERGRKIAAAEHEAQRQRNAQRSTQSSKPNGAGYHPDLDDDIPF